MNVDTLRKYVGNPNAYASQQADGSYRPVRDPLTPDILSAHLSGVITVGTYILDFDKARSIVFDIDDGSLVTAKRLSLACKRRGLLTAIEFSGRKGYHVWVLFSQYEPASDVRRLARSIAAECDFKGEVFPKQDAARDLGNLVKLPWGIHKATGARSRFIGAPALATAHDRFTAAVDSLPPEAVVDKGSFGPLPCMESIQTVPPGTGERNNLLFHFATMLRRAGLEDPYVETVVHELNRKSPQPMEDYELESIVKNSAFAGPVCDQLNEERHCGARCIKNRQHGLSLRPGQLRHGPEGELIVVAVGRRDGDVVEVVHPDIQQARAALAPKGA